MKESIWGKGDKLTLKVLNKLQLKGNWLDLAAGDGRYVSKLLKKVDSLVATDIDRKALRKLLYIVSKEKKCKIKTKVFDITKKFPFKDKTFDGVFCAGTLHLFPKKVLIKILAEIGRVLKPKGIVVIDFATDLRRYFPNSKPKTFKNEPKYKLNSAKQFLKNSFKDYNVKIYNSKFTDDLTNIPKYGWVSKGNFVLMVAKKP